MNKIISITSKSSYLKFSRKCDGIRKTIPIHRLVAFHFVDNPLRKKYINHLDCNKQNNFFMNLEWCTPKENCEHAAKNKLYIKTYNKGENHPKCKLSNEQVLSIFNSNMKYKEIADNFNVHIATVGFIKNGSIWSHITGKIITSS